VTAALNPPPTRLLSWSQLVREADPDYTRLSLQPWVFSFSNGRLFVDWLPLYDFGPPGDGLTDNAGILGLTSPNDWPTNTRGLQGGDLYSNGGVPQIFPGFTPGPPTIIEFGDISADALLALGARGLPWTRPANPNGILWNPGGSTGGPIYITSYIADFTLDSSFFGVLDQNRIG
jgi:hypothetical protein